MKSLSGERRRREALVRHVSYFSRAFFVKRESARLFRWHKSLWGRPWNLFKDELFDRPLGYQITSHLLSLFRVFT